MASPHFILPRPNHPEFFAQYVCTSYMKTPGIGVLGGPECKPGREGGTHGDGELDGELLGTGAYRSPVSRHIGGTLFALVP
jgi:hypothetical protein